MRANSSVIAPVTSTQGISPGCYPASTKCFAPLAAINEQDDNSVKVDDGELLGDFVSSMIHTFDMKTQCLHLHQELHLAQ